MSDENALTTPPPPAELGRRTVLAGAAWTIPAIAAASVAPVAAAASGTVALAFDRASYSTLPCGGITDAYVTTTIDGIPAAGVSVTTVLSGGYVFYPAVTTTNTQVSGSDGRISLPAISAPTTGGNATMSATASGAASVSSPLSASPGIALSRFVQVTTSGQMRQYPFTDLSTDWRSVKAQMFLTPTNDLYYVGTQIASSVVAAVGYTYGRWNIVDYVLADGSARSFVRNTTAGTSTDSAVSGTPVGSTPVGALGFIDSNNDLYYSGSKIASGVSHCVGYAIQNSYVLEYVVASSGAMRRYTNNKASGTSSDTAFSGVPVDSVPLGARSFLAPSKDLYHGSTQVASGVSSAVAYTFQGSYVIEYVLSANGSIRRFVNDTSTSQQTDSPVTGIPSGSTPVGAQMYITPSNDLNFQQTRVATGVSRAIGYTFPTEYIVEYVGTPVYEGNVTC